MGMDMILNILLFWIVWKFLWKKSRNKHMILHGYTASADIIAFAIFAAIAVIVTFVPFFIMGGTNMIIPFIAFGGIFTAYAVTVRVPFGAEKEKYEPVDPSYRIDLH